MKEITLPGVKELPESMALNLERLEFEPGSIDAIGPRQTREYVEGMHYSMKHIFK